MKSLTETFFMGLKYVLIAAALFFMLFFIIGWKGLALLICGFMLLVLFGVLCLLIGIGIDAWNE